MNDDLDLLRNDWPICPFCGYEDDGAWEYSLGNHLGVEGSDDIECCSCGETFHCERGMDIWYTTSKIDKAREGER